MSCWGDWSLLTSFDFHKFLSAGHESKLFPDLKRLLKHQGAFHSSLLPSSNAFEGCFWPPVMLQTGSGASYVVFGRIDVFFVPCSCKPADTGDASENHSSWAAFSAHRNTFGLLHLRMRQLLKRTWIFSDPALWEAFSRDPNLFSKLFNKKITGMATAAKPNLCPLAWTNELLIALLEELLVKFRENFEVFQSALSQIHLQTAVAPQSSLPVPPNARATPLIEDIVVAK